MNIVKELISRGAKVDALGGIFGSTLQAATAGGHGEIVSLLLFNPLVDPNISGGLPGNLLQAALARNSNEIVSLLVPHEASFNPNGGRLWKLAYNGLKRWQKSRLYSIAKSTVTLPQLTGRQKLLAYIIRLNSEPVQRPDRASRWGEKMESSASLDVEMLERNCRMGKLDEVGFLYQRIPFLGRITDPTDSSVGHSYSV